MPELYCHLHMQDGGISEGVAVVGRVLNPDVSVIDMDARRFRRSSCTAEVRLSSLFVPGKCAPGSIQDDWSSVDMLLIVDASGVTSGWLRSKELAGPKYVCLVVVSTGGNSDRGSCLPCSVCGVGVPVPVPVLSPRLQPKSVDRIASTTT
jgi:hypothetical protein